MQFSKNTLAFALARVYHHILGLFCERVSRIDCQSSVCQHRQGLDTIFAYPGGASMPMHQSLTHQASRLRTILPRHEQGGIFAAEGYARTTGKVGVCMATSGPGATNLVTGLADAKMDS